MTPPVPLTKYNYQYLNESGFDYTNKSSSQSWSRPRNGPLFKSEAQLASTSYQAKMDRTNQYLAIQFSPDISDR
jgi:hypothetical protein